VTQPARNLAIEGRLDNVWFLIRDRNAKFLGPGCISVVTGLGAHEPSVEKEHVLPILDAMG